MIYYISRILLLCLFTIHFIRLFKKYNTLTNIKKIMCIVLSTFVMLISMIFPIENILLKFNSIESLVKYNFVGNVSNTVEGDNSCLVFLDSNFSGSSMRLIQKKGEQYFVEKLFSLKKISAKADNKITCDLYKDNNSNDYYVIVSGLVDDREKVTIKDNQNSKFIDLSNEDGGDVYIYYGAYVSKMQSGYNVTINESTINLL